MRRSGGALTHHTSGRQRDRRQVGAGVLVVEHKLGLHIVSAIFQIEQRLARVAEGIAVHHHLGVSGEVDHVDTEDLRRYRYMGSSW